MLLLELVLESTYMRSTYSIEKVYCVKKAMENIVVEEFSSVDEVLIFDSSERDKSILYEFVIEIIMQSFISVVLIFEISVISVIFES